MSIWYGVPGERWPLPAVARELAAAARWAARPGPVWIAGLGYPGIDRVLDAVVFALALVGRAGVALPAPLAPAAAGGVRLPLLPFVDLEITGLGSLLLHGVLLLVPLLLVFRLDVGLARAGERAAAGDEGAGRTLRRAWRAGRGEGRTALGMWLTLVLLFLGASVAVLGPFVLVVQALGLEEVSLPLLGLLFPLVLVVAAYGVVLQVLNQLALHSLAQNHRGVLSALTHAWRLLRAQPWVAARAGALDLGLFLVLLALEELASGGNAQLPLALVVLAAAAFAGVLRARFWGAIYRGVGGLGPADRVPGLREAPESAAAAAKGW